MEKDGKQKRNRLKNGLTTGTLLSVEETVRIRATGVEKHETVLHEENIESSPFRKLVRKTISFMKTIHRKGVQKIKTIALNNYELFIRRHC